MTLLQLQVFVAVVEEQSFTRAGDKLGLSQSAVSHAIRKLEEQWEIRLLERNRNGIFVTPTGKRLYEKAKEIIGLVEVMEQEVTKEKGLLAGKVRIGSFPTASYRLLPDVFAMFQERYPNIEVQLLEGGYNEIRSWLNQAIIDLALLPVPDHDFESISLLYDPFVIVVPDHHPLTHKQNASLKDLEDHDFILPLAGLEDTIQKWTEHVGIRPRIVYSLQNTISILAMVQKGLGISIVPQLASIPQGVTALPMKTGLSRTIGLTARSFQHASPAVHAMTSTFQEIYQHRTTT